VFRGIKISLSASEVFSEDVRLLPCCSEFAPDFYEVGKSYPTSLELRVGKRNCGLPWPAPKLL